MGMSKKELKDMPVFPFPKELFPQGNPNLDSTQTIKTCERNRGVYGRLDSAAPIIIAETIFAALNTAAEHILLRSGTFPEGMKFAKSGAKGGLPPSLISLLAKGQASEVAGAFFGSAGSLAGSSRSQDPRFRRGPDGRFPCRSKIQDSDDDDEDDDGDSSGGWETASDDELGEEGGDAGSGDSGGEPEAGGEISGLPRGDQGGGAGQTSGPAGGKPVWPDMTGSGGGGGEGESQQGIPAPTPGSDAPPIPLSALREWFDAAKLGSVPLMSSLLSRHGPGLLLAQGTGLGHSAMHW